ncbi:MULTISPECIES: hypothetical protein [unclassified Streptomyces]
MPPTEERDTDARRGHAGCERQTEMDLAGALAAAEAASPVESV